MTGTQIAYYFLCKRKLWLFSNNIVNEHTSDTVAIGKFISEETYKREKHEIKIGDISLDFYDAKNKIIHEIKKSDKMEETHIWQVKYYIYVLWENGIEGVVGKIDYPKLKRTLDVELTEDDKKRIEEIKKEISEIISEKSVPPVVNKPFCKNCSYYDLCYV